VFFLEGEMEFELAGRVYHPRPGEELLIPADSTDITVNWESN
jgi:hypothetical protein